MHWNDIPLFPMSCYEVDIGWQYLERHLETEMKQGLDLECATHADTLQLYLNINVGGTPHTADEIEKVRAMVKALSVPK